MYNRILNLSNALNRKSLFLLGPRQTGKSTFLHELKTQAYYIDLLNSAEYHLLLRSPQKLAEMISAHRNQYSVFIIDEVQKIPLLLDEVHRLIERDKALRFILTGSSARKLKRDGANLLGGRASKISMCPLVYPELATDPQKPRTWKDVIQIGSLPSILTSDEPHKDLQDYVGLYLREEIQAEGLTRSLDNFSRFLEFAALSQGEQINFTAVGADAQVPPRTVVDYFQVLEDTLVGQLLPAFTKTKKRKAMSTAKFYFFDIGVGHALVNRTHLPENTPEFGKALEHLIFTELRAYISYMQRAEMLYYWRSTSQFEVDFVIQINPKEIIGIEVKTNKNPNPRDYKGLEALAEEFPKMRKIVVCNTDVSRKTEGQVEIWPIESFLKSLWSQEIF